MVGLFSAHPKRNHNSSGYRRLEEFAPLYPEMAELLVFIIRMLELLVLMAIYVRPAMK